MPEFLDGLVQRLHSEHSDLLETIRGGDWSDGTQEALRNGVAEFADDFGYDLDEDGQPLSEDDELRAEEGRRSRDGDGDGDGKGDETTEQEPAAVAAGS